MANLKVLDGDGTAKYLSTDGAGTNADPHVSHHVLDANTDGVYIGDIKFGESLLAGTNAIGKLAANSGVDIGDVTINNAGGASAVNIQDGGNTITVDGTIAATQSGTWNIGTVTTVTGVTTVSTLTTITNPVAIKNAAADTVTGVSGTYDTIDVSLTNGTYRATIDSSGYLTTNINGTITVAGSVTADTELPAAGTLGDAMANPATPLIGAALLGWDVTNTCWERLKTDESGILQVKAAANTGVDIGDVTINNAAGSAVYVREGTSASWNIRALTNADAVSVEQSTAASLNCTEASASNILTAVQLIDDTVAVLGTATYAEATTSAFVIGAVRNDTLATLVNTDNEIAPLQVDASGALYVNLSGEGIDMNIEGVAAEDANAAGNPVLVGGRYDASPRSLDDTDVGAIALDADGAVHISDGGNTVTVDGTVTAAQATHDNLKCNANVQQGDADVTSSNELYVRGSGTAGSADAAVLTVQGVASMTPILATLQASDGTDIGNVDIASASFEKAEDAGHSTGDKGVMALAVRHDTISSLCGTDLDYTPLQVDATGYLYTKDKNAASLAVVGGGAESTALRVTIANDSTGVLTVDDGGSSLTVDGSVTANTELAAAAALSDTFGNPTTATVGAMNMVWDDANSHWERLIGIEGLSDSDAGDAVTLKSYNNDETGLMPAVILGYDDTTNDNAYRALAVTSSGALEIADGGNTITIDGAVAATQSGTWNIGTVTPGTAATNLGKAEDAGHASGDVGVMALTVRQNSAAALSGTDADYQPLITDTNGRLHVLDANSASLAVVGGGAESTALRVTIANDSTGVLSVDDGGGTLTVDGTVTATPSGIQEIEGDEAEGSGNLPQPVLIGGDDGTDIKNINVDASTGDVQVDVTNQVDVGGATPVVTPITGSASPFSTSYAPSADFWLESITLHLSAAGTTSEPFTVTLNATDGGAYDTLLFSQDLSKGAVTDLVWVPEGGPMLFENGDAIDVAWNNAESRTYGLRITSRLA